MRGDVVGLENVVRGCVPQAEVHRAAGDEEPTIFRMKGYPRCGEALILGDLLHLLVKDEIDTQLRYDTRSEGKLQNSIGHHLFRGLF